MLTYKSPDDAVNLARQTLSSEADRNLVAARGRKMVGDLYNKTLQWRRFVEIVSLI
jgi:hypothetical protein